jgi:integrase
VNAIVPCRHDRRTEIGALLDRLSNYKENLETRKTWQIELCGVEGATPNVREERRILRRVVRERQTFSSILFHGKTSPEMSTRQAGGHQRKKTPALAATTAITARAIVDARGKYSSIHERACEALTAAAGKKAVADLAGLDAVKAASFLTSPPYKASSAHFYRVALRWLLRAIGRQEIAAFVPRLDQPGPRLKLVSAATVENLLAVASPALQLMILLCHDCALRSGTAVGLTSSNYDTTTKTITTITKRSRVAHVKCTARLRNMIEQALRMEALDPAKKGASLCGLLSPSRRPLTYDALLNQFHEAQKKIGVKDIRLHDLRRTMAVQTFRVTGHNFHAVQALLAHQNVNSTLWYLAGEAEMPNRQVLEQAASHAAERPEDEDRFQQPSIKR